MRNYSHPQAGNNQNFKTLIYFTLPPRGSICRNTDAPSSWVCLFVTLLGVRVATLATIHILLLSARNNMRCLDPGHSYSVDVYDAAQPAEAFLVFMKREGNSYPFNVGHYSGTNCQEVIRVLIDRVKYLQKQIPCPENGVIIDHLRGALRAFEYRAARRHARRLGNLPADIESVRVCSQCGHIGCEVHEIKTAELKK